MKGVAWALQKTGHTLRGWEGVMLGNVPVGAGLSSSAALELAALRAFAAVSELPWDPVWMAQIGQKAENEWVGVKSGIMDQLVSSVGKTNHALLLDCRSLETEWVPIPPQAAIVVLDTSTRRSLVNSVYNERRSQCERAARRLKVAALRDISLEQFETQAPLLDEQIQSRARHVISENQRTLQAVAALKESDLKRFGSLMNESHRSLRDDFEVSSAALDQFVDCAQQQPGCFGARMTGAGLGGCAIAVVDRTFVQEFGPQVAECYQRSTGLIPQIYTCQASPGSEVIRL